jgi:hypothetical protein
VKEGAKTGAQRQADLKARRIAAGLVPVTNLWTHPDDVSALREAAAKLARRRARLVAKHAKRKEIKDAEIT